MTESLRVRLDGRPVREPFSGTGVYVVELWRALLALGESGRVSPDLMLFDFLGSNRQLKRLNLGHDKTQVLRVLHRKVFNGLGVVGLPAPFWTRRGRAFDVFHITYPERVPRLPSKVAAVMTVHDCVSLRHPEWVPARIRDSFQRSVAWAIRSGVVFLTVSEFTRSELCHLTDADPDRVFVSHNGISHMSPARDQSSIDPTAPYLLYVGNLEPRKGVPDLVHAYLASGLRGDVQLIIAGAKLWASGELLNEAADAIAAGDIRVLGYVSAAERERLFRSAVALCYPSYYEGFGLPPLEAMQVGTPTIAYRTGAAEETVGTSGILVDVGDVDGLRAAMQALASDRGLRDRMSRAGRVQASKFSWANTATTTRRAYGKAFELARD